MQAGRKAALSLGTALLSERARKDLDRLDPPSRRRALKFIAERMVGDTLPANVDVRPLEGRTPWLRVRVGDLRILCRRLTKADRGSDGRGYLIARIVLRRDLDRAVSHL